MARIDRLPDESRRTLRVASVVGRQFPVRVLEQVLGEQAVEGGGAIGVLSSLENAGMLRLATLEPELEYLFQHSLVQEAAYASLLTNDRKQLHLAVGKAVERLYPDRLQENAAILARHYSEAGKEKQALHYFILAGKSGIDCYCNQEAEGHFRPPWRSRLRPASGVSCSPGWGWRSPARGACRRRSRSGKTPSSSIRQPVI